MDEGNALRLNVPVADRQCQLLKWTPWPFDNPSLLGHCSVTFSGWTIHNVPVFRKADGSLSVGTPSAAEIDREGHIKGGRQAAIPPHAVFRECRCARTVAALSARRPRGWRHRRCAVIASNFEAIPPILKSHPRWVFWRQVSRKGKVHQATADTPASSTDPRTWAEFTEIADGYQHQKANLFDGIGSAWEPSTTTSTPAALISMPVSTNRETSPSGHVLSLRH